MGRVREDKRRRKRKSQKKEALCPGARKGRKSRETPVFFKWFEVSLWWHIPEGRKVGSLKRRVRSQRARLRDENCTPMSGAKHIFQVKCNPSNIFLHLTNNSSLRSTFRSCDVEKVHAVVAQSTFASEKAKSTSHSDHFWKLRMSKKLNAVVTRSTFRSQNVKNTTCSDHFLDVQMLVRVAGARDCAPSQKWAKREGFVAFPKTMAGVGHLTEGSAKMDFAWQGQYMAVQETCWSEMLAGQAADFLRGVAFWSIRSSGLLRWFYVTGAALRMTWHHFFVAGAVL